jgi:hypothetical protein
MGEGIKRFSVRTFTFKMRGDLEGGGGKMKINLYSEKIFNDLKNKT